MGALSVVFGLLRGAVPLVGGFFTGGLTWVWGALSVAWGTEIGRTVIVGIGCLFGGWVWGFSHEHAVKERAVAAAIEQTAAARDAEWSKKLEQANAKTDERVAEAKAASKAVPSASALSDADLVRKCAKSPACRSQFAARRRVQGNSVSDVGH